MVARLVVGIAGSLNQTTWHLIQLLSIHPQIGLNYVGTPEPLPRRLPQGPSSADPISLQPLDPSALVAAQVVFLNLPPGQAAALVPELLAHCQVIDLSADYRSVRPDLDPTVVYGLPELYGDRLRQGRLISCPGSVPTATLLALAPLLKYGLIEPDNIVIDAKQGSNTAVLQPLPLTQQPDTAEIEQVCRELFGADVLLQCTGHQVPGLCGLSVTLSANLRDPGLVSEDLVTIYRTRYRQSAWVQVLPVGQLPMPRAVLGTNRCSLGLEVDLRTQRIVLVATLDPQLKGAVGQAVQCLNLMAGWEETLALPQHGFC